MNPSSVWSAWKAELLHMVTDRSVMLVMIGGILFYALLYPLPYQKNMPGEQTLAVLDQDRTALARKLIRMADCWLFHRALNATFIWGSPSMSCSQGTPVIS